ncbi:MAG: hypothetical protein ABI843_07025 [Dokdonella sp.]
MTIPETDTLRRWLLHQLTPVQSEALEDRLFDDDARQDGSFTAALHETEHDLLDDYAHDRLGADERKAVERHLLQTAHDLSRLTFARALANRQPDTDRAMPRGARRAHASALRRNDRKPRWRLVLGGALAAGFAAAVFVLSGIQPRLPSPPDATATATAATQTIILLASAQRGANELEARVEHDAANVRLQAEVAQPQTGAHYALRVGEGSRTVYTAEDLPVRQAGPYHYIEAVVPADVLGVGARQISVQPQGSTAAAFAWTVRMTTDR